jgi:hypothetical protein
MASTWGMPANFMSSNEIGLRSFVDSEGGVGFVPSLILRDPSSNGIGLRSFFDSEGPSIASSWTTPAERAGKSAHLHRLRLHGGGI